MAEQKFNAGDVVRLKSGGPRMTVIKYEPEEGTNINCQWFDQDKNLQEKSFSQDAINLYKSPSVTTTSSPKRNHYF